MAPGEIRGAGMTNRAASKGQGRERCRRRERVVDAGGGGPQQGVEETIRSPNQAPPLLERRLFLSNRTDSAE